VPVTLTPKTKLAIDPTSIRVDEAAGSRTLTGAGDALSATGPGLTTDTGCGEGTGAIGKGLLAAVATGLAISTMLLQHGQAMICPMSDSLRTESRAWQVTQVTLKSSAALMLSVPLWRQNPCCFQYNKYGVQVGNAAGRNRENGQFGSGSTPQRSLAFSENWAFGRRPRTWTFFTDGCVYDWTAGGPLLQRAARTFSSCAT
jgi:hypothetical protein